MTVARALIVVPRAGMALAVLCTVGTALVAAGYRHDPMAITLALAMPALLALPIVGSAAVRSMPTNGVGWMLIAAGVAVPLATCAYLYSLAAFEGGADLPAARLAGWLDGWPWVPALVLLPTLGLLLFPDGRLPGPRWRPLFWAELLVLAGLTASPLFSPGLLDFPEQPNPTRLPGAAGESAEGLLALIAFVPPLSTLSAVSLWRRARAASDPVEASAIRLVLPAAWFVAASWWCCMIVTSVGGESVDVLPLEVLALLSIAISAWVAIRRYGLFDARRVVNRGMVYGALSACVIAVYLGIAAAVGRYVSEALSGPVAIVVAALVALPLRDQLQHRANRLLYGQRDDPYGAFVRLGRRLSDAVQPADVLPAVARTVREALRLRHVAVVLGDNVAAADGVPGHGRSESFTLTFAHERIGALVAESEDDSFTETERQLLRSIAPQVAAAAHSVSLLSEVVRSRERLVAATEEDRRRLRRDLHDGLGPTLASMVLGLQLARRRVEADPAAVRERLDEATAQAQEAVAEVRRLVHGLRPPALDELGLVGALEQRARDLGPISVVGPGQPLRLPASVEVAAFRIALEAMTNVARHASAGACTVRVEVDSALHLEIDDDGVGLPDGYRAGVGITSMRERAAELGGTCVLARRHPAGTRVAVALPLEVA